MKKIDMEAHFYTTEYLDALRAREGYPRLTEGTADRSRRLWYAPEVGQPFADFLLNALTDFGGERLEKMDALGVDVQVLSLSAPGLEQLDSSVGTALARKSNDFLARVIREYPGRYMGYAALSPKDPESAADELERAVKELGLIGWNTHSNYGDSYLDEERYWPILERAAKLNVPVYLHPTVPAIPQARTYGFAIAGAPFGFGMETAMCMMRLIYSGVFDRCPGLTIILGHLGEALPYWLWRLDNIYLRNPVSAKLKKAPSEYFKEHFFVTTSGMCWQPPLLCSYLALGAEKILFAVDYPFLPMQKGVQFMEAAPISESDKEKVFHANAEKLFGL